MFAALDPEALTGCWKGNTLSVLLNASDAHEVLVTAAVATRRAVFGSSANVLLTGGVFSLDDVSISSARRVLSSGILGVAGTPLPEGCRVRHRLRQLASHPTWHPVRRDPAHLRSALATTSTRQCWDPYLPLLYATLCGILLVELLRRSPSNSHEG